MGTRWGEICQQIRIDSNLVEGRQQLWKILERYQDVFAWNKGELGCCTVGEHFVDMQGSRLAELFLVDCLIGRRPK